jgi:hypothetical protein
VFNWYYILWGCTVSYTRIITEAQRGHSDFILFPISWPRVITQKKQKTKCYLVATRYNSEKQNKKQTITISWPRVITQKKTEKQKICYLVPTSYNSEKKNCYLVPTSYNSEKNNKKKQQNLLSRGHELELRKKQQQKFAILLWRVNRPVSFLF